MNELTLWAWAVAALVAFFIGLSKTGISGLGTLCVVLLANVFPSTRQVSGLMLPWLILGDVFGVLVFRRHADWSSVVRLTPWTVAGVLVGWAALGRMDDAMAARTIGALVVGLVVVQSYRQLRGLDTSTVPGWAAAMIGLLAGFSTMVANAAGPLMSLYLLAMRLPKLQFVGTGAVFFMALNVFKVPFSVQLGLITPETLWFNLKLAPLVILGALGGPWLLERIPQKQFEWLALVLSAVAGARLLWPH